MRNRRPPNRWRPSVAIAPPGAPPLPPQLDRGTENNSLTRFKDMVPVRVATGMPVGDSWSGAELNKHSVRPSLYGGPHYILALGRDVAVGDDVKFVPTFTAHMHMPPGSALASEENRKAASDMAENLMVLLNITRRREDP